MRIGLDFRFLTLGRHALVRGIPRFSLEQLQAVLAHDTENTYLLLCDPGVDLQGIRPEILAAPNAHVVCAPEAVQSRSLTSEDGPASLALFSAYQGWLEELHLDLYHSTCTFWLGTANLPGYYDSAYVATAYDLIPLLYPAQYMPNQDESEAYQRRLIFVQQATRVAAISHATASDLTDHLGIPAERIDITPPAVSPCFRPLPPDVTRMILAALAHRTRTWPRRRAQLPAQYVLCITDLHYSKNLTTLLPAYAALPMATREQAPLVVAGQLGRREDEVVQGMAEQLGVERNLILTGRLSDDELTALYNGATVMVHPSHHEGFGLPVAEALRCGAPVITTTRSALPEVAGDAAVLVDSDDQAAFTGAIELVLHDRDLRDDLRRRGFVQASRFTADALAQATLECYRRAASMSSSAPTTPAPIRIALWAPVPPQCSTVSDYTDDVVTALAAESGVEIDIFVDDGVLPPARVMRAARVHHWSDFDRCARHLSFDVTLYQVGLSPSSQYMEPAMLSHPGIVVLHDLRWSRGMLAAALAQPGGSARFRGELAALEGERAAREWDRIRVLPLRARHAAEDAFLDDHLMLGRVVDAATRCAVLTPAAAGELIRRYPQATVSVIPDGVSDPAAAGGGFDRPAARAYLRIDPETFVIVVPGPIDPDRHAETALQSLADLKALGVEALLALVGWVPAPEYHDVLRARAETLGLSDAVRFTGPVAHVDLDAYMAAADAVVVLERAGTLRLPYGVPRALAAGRSLIVSDAPGTATLPAAACIRIAESPHVGMELTDALNGLASDRERRLRLERAAREHYKASAQLEPMVNAYLSLVREETGRTAARGARPAAVEPRPALMGRPLPREGPLRYSKACELEDFTHPQLQDVIRSVCPHKLAAFGPDFPRGFEYRKDWEVAMAVRTLADHGALRPDARILGVAAGTEDTIFYLTRHVGEVVAIDRYLDPGEWEETAPSMMLLHPELLAPFAFERSRLTALHMDARILGYPDESFDGIFSSGSIEHFGDLQTIAAAAYEMARVLKPGGILSLSTELLLFPEANGTGAHYPGLFLLSPDELQRYIIEASGLEPIDDLDVSVSHWTLGTAREINSSVMARNARVRMQPNGFRRPDWTGWDMPHIVMELRDKRFTSVHLALRRAAVHPVRDNAWAQPSPALRAAVAQSAAAVSEEAAALAAGNRAPNGTRRANVLGDALRDITASRASAERRLRVLRAEIDAATAEVEGDLQEAAMPRAEALPRVEVYGSTPDEGNGSVPPPARPRIDAASELPPAGTIACAMQTPLGHPYTVVVQRDASDIISSTFLAGDGGYVNPHLISLILALVPFGGTVVDIGANIGSITLPVAAAGRKVVAVEASATNVWLLEAGIAMSHVGDRVRVIPTAVGDRLGTASFVPFGPYGHLVDGDAEGATAVSLTTLDALFEAEHLDRVGLVKVDVEGTELDVLRGMSGIAQHPDAPYLIVECCPYTLAKFGHTAADLVSLLESYGYAVYNIDINRLMRRRPDEVQVTTVMDVLAAKRGVRGVRGWRVEPPMELRELVGRIEAESQWPNPDCRASLARVARDLHPDVLALPEVRAAMLRLRRDPDATVRAAAAWWHEHDRPGDDNA